MDTSIWGQLRLVPNLITCTPRKTDSKWISAHWQRLPTFRDRTKIPLSAVERQKRNACTSIFFVESLRVIYFVTHSRLFCHFPEHTHVFVTYVNLNIWLSLFFFFQVSGERTLFAKLLAWHPTSTNGWCSKFTQLHTYLRYPHWESSDPSCMPWNTHFFALSTKCLFTCFERFNTS